MLQNKCRHSLALPLDSCSFCKSSAPESLLNVCFDYINDHLDTLCVYDSQGKLQLMDGVTLPVEISEKLLSIRSNSIKSTVSVNSRFINIFRDTQRTRLKRVKLHKTLIDNYDLEVLLKHRLHELDISHSPELTSSCIRYITEYGTSLHSLSIEDTNIFPKNIYGNLKFTEEHYDKGFIFLAPSLRKLCLRGLQELQVDFYMLLLNHLSTLTHLDLSNCSYLKDFDYTEHLTNLVSLVLYNVDNIESKIVSICKLKTLRHLDISTSKEERGNFSKGSEVLTFIVESLPHLVSLDISGTNLAGRGVAEQSHMTYRSDIPGLSSRVNNPFQYLGLYETTHDACLRHDIPAKLIAGNANEEQILIAALAFLDRPDMLQKILNELFHVFRYETCEYVGQALNIVLEAMDKHLHERHIQISGSATLFYIVKGTGKELHDVVLVKRRIITTLLNGMSVHRNDDTMMRNGCLTLCQFKIPTDVLFDYERLVDILLHSVHGMQQDSFVQRIGIYLLNSLACQVDGQQKVKLGDLGTINRMIWLISERLQRSFCDDVLEVAWSTMWNVTDETPSNCRKFLECNGMEHFLLCLQKFPDREELLRNMMGLLGNVAEVQELRYYLVTPEYLDVFSHLLDSESDGIEVSYNAAGVISHIASDGPEVWTVSKPSREEVLRKMVLAIQRWDISSQRNINYRSFEPILYLVKVYHTPECQHWAVWALANLTKVYPDKYCTLIEKEGGLDLLQELIMNSAPPEAVKHLARIVIDNCRVYKDGWQELDALLDG
ncbi:protein zer-1 homolog isoform X2 [Aethina tumida]|uniref:protein zer-1 homolog isoform X2 n=1 Tax=Aethina tumida TaxID=116153 RepID=UPI0021482331|nr:protein zer-1 homolog isoform X2 [Aethina tumida]